MASTPNCYVTANVQGIGTHSPGPIKTSGLVAVDSQRTMSIPMMNNTAPPVLTGSPAVVGLGQPALGLHATPPAPSPGGMISAPVVGDPRVLDKRRLQELVKEVDPMEQLDDDVEEALLQIADDFIETVVSSSCQIAKHRKSNSLDAKDVQLHLERNWNMWIPGFGSDELRPYKRSCTTEAHKQRMALIRKTLKKS